MLARGRPRRQGQQAAPHRDLLSRVRAGPAARRPRALARRCCTRCSSRSGPSTRYMDMVANALVADLHADRKERALSLLHAIFGVGALLGPLYARVLVDATGAWTNAYTLLGAAGLAVLASRLSLRARRGAQRSPVPAAARGGAGRLLRSRDVWLLAAILFLYVVHQSGLTVWLPTYMEREMGASKWLASVGPSLLWLGIVAGRFLTSALAMRLGGRRILVWGHVAGGRGADGGGALSLAGALAAGVVAAGVATGCRLPAHGRDRLRAAPPRNGRRDVDAVRQRKPRPHGVPVGRRRSGRPRWACFPACSSRASPCWREALSRCASAIGPRWARRTRRRGRARDSRRWLTRRERRAATLPICASLSRSPTQVHIWKRLVASLRPSAPPTGSPLHSISASPLASPPPLRTRAEKPRPPAAAVCLPAAAGSSAYAAEGLLKKLRTRRAVCPSGLLTRYPMRPQRDPALYPTPKQPVSVEPQPDAPRPDALAVEPRGLADVAVLHLADVGTTSVPPGCSRASTRASLATPSRLASSSVTSCSNPA